MNIKRILAVLLIIVMAFSLFACGAEESASQAEAITSASDIAANGEKTDERNVPDSTAPESTSEEEQSTSDEVSSTSEENSETTTSTTEPSTTSTTKPTTSTTKPTSSTTSTTKSTTSTTKSTSSTTSTTKSTSSTTKSTTSASRSESSSSSTQEASSTTSTTKSTTSTTKTANATFFDDVAFVGDSITVGLKNYTTYMRNQGKACLGKARFVCNTSLGYTNSLWALGAKNNVHPYVNGVKYRVPDGIKALGGVKKAFIMFGMNDFMIYGFDKTVQNAVTLITEIIQKNPGIKIYVQSVLPIIKSKENTKLKNNASIDILNTKLKEMCSQHGWTFVNVAPAFKISDNSLNPAYCSDNTSNGMGMHLNYQGCAAWVNKLMSIFG